MKPRRKGSLSIFTCAIVFLFLPITFSYGQSVNYYYDDLNRLIRIDYGGGTVIDYTYDDVGNRITENIRQVVLPVTTASPAGGVYRTPQSVTLTCSDAGGPGCGNIYYTTDGSTPNVSSPVYSSPILIVSNTTLKYFAADISNPPDYEGVKTQTYTIDTVPPTVTASPAGGTYSTAQSVTLTCADTGSGCDKIYYTTDGTTPTTSSPVYSSPINISVTKTLKFFARDLAGNSGAVQSQTYIISGSLVVTAGGLTSSGNQGGPFNPSSKAYTLQNIGGTSINKERYRTPLEA